MKKINHLAWLVRSENVAHYVGQLEALLDTKFERMSEESADAYVNWDSGRGICVGAEMTPADPEERLAAIRSFAEKVDDIREVSLGDFVGIGLVLCQIAYAHERDGDASK